MRPLEELKALKLNRQREQHPNFPEHALPKPKYSDRTANGLTKCIIDFLNLSGWQAERISNTGRRIDRRKTVTNTLGAKQTVGKVEWVKGSGRKGTADISATIAGRSVKIEIKKGKDQQSKHQQDYQREVEDAGGIYLIARDFRGFYRWYCDFLKKEKPHGDGASLNR